MAAQTLIVSSQKFHKCFLEIPAIFPSYTHIIILSRFRKKAGQTDWSFYMVAVWLGNTLKYKQMYHQEILNSELLTGQIISG